MGKQVATVLLVFFLGLGSNPVISSDSPVAGRVDVSGLPYEHVADLSSTPSESKNAFLLRIAPQLRAYSDRTGFEACGFIATDGQGRFSVVLGSSLSHIGCANDPQRRMSGTISTGETIHSHGRPGLRVRLNAADVLMMGNPSNPPHYVGGSDLSHFSDADFAVPGGYLATPTGLIHQAGAGAVETVGAYLQVQLASPAVPF
jgi:hypothetical protein